MGYEDVIPRKRRLSHCPTSTERDLTQPGHIEHNNAIFASLPNELRNIRIVSLIVIRLYHLR